MLVARAADIRSVIPRVLGLLAFVCCGLVVLSFAMFARDQVAGASARQQNEVATSVPSAPASHKTGQPRKFIDGAAHVLTSPFQSIVQSKNAWVVHSLPAVFALLIYGFGLGFVARYSRGLT